MTTILSGSASQALAGRLARALEATLLETSYDRFPNGDLFVSLDVDHDLALEDERVIVVASTASSDAHLELLLLQDAAREAGATEIVTVIPYMGYDRQEQAFNPGEPVSSRAVARAISSGTDEVVLVTPHEDVVCDFFEPTARQVDGATVLADALPDDLDHPVFIAPDVGAVSLAETVREAYGRGSTDYFEKTRHSETAVDISPSDIDVDGRDVVVVDDSISTGGTMSEAVGVLTQRGVGRVYVTCVHPVLARSAVTRLYTAGVEAIYGTDTLERAVSSVSVAPVLAETLELTE